MNTRARRWTGGTRTRCAGAAESGGGIACVEIAAAARRGEGAATVAAVLFVCASE